MDSCATTVSAATTTSLVLAAAGAANEEAEAEEEEEEEAGKAAAGTGTAQDCAPQNAPASIARAGSHNAVPSSGPCPR